MAAGAEWRNRCGQTAGTASNLSWARLKPYSRTYKGRLKSTGAAMFFDVDLTDEYARSGVVNGAVSNYWEELSGRFSSETYAGLTHRLRDTLGATGIDETENLETKLKALTMTQPVDQSLIDTLTGLNAEATFGLDTDDYHGSVKFQQQLRETSLKHLGEEHPFTISVINRLAHSLRLLDPQESLELRDQALKLTTKSRGAEHSESMLTVMNFAEALADVGRTEEALASGTQVLEARIRMSGEDHRETIRVMDNLGNYLSTMGRNEEAASFQRRVLEALRKRSPPDHPLVLMARSTLEQTMEKIEKNPHKARESSPTMNTGRF